MVRGLLTNEKMEEKISNENEKCLHRLSQNTIVEDVTHCL